MGISFGKRKVKIKLLGQTETATEEEKPKVPVPIYQPETVSKAKPKVNRTFKEALKEITEQSKKLNLSDFTVYQYYYSDGRYKFSKVTGNSVLSEITLEKYWSTAEPTVFRRATGRNTEAGLLFSVGLTARIISLSGHQFSTKHLQTKE